MHIPFKIVNGKLHGLNLNKENSHKAKDIKLRQTNKKLFLEIA